MPQTIRGLKVITLFFTLFYFFYPVCAQSPGGVSNHLTLWLRADTGTSTTSNGSPVSTWNDRSGKAYNASQATSANQPVYNRNTTDNINFNPVLKFDGTNDQLVIANQSALNGILTAFSVYNNSSSTGSRSPLGSQNSTTSGWNYFVSGTTRYLFGFRSGLTNISSGTGKLNTTEIGSFDLQPGVTLPASIYVNGRTVSTGNISYQSNTSGGLSIGASGTGNNYFQGRIAETIIYDSLLSSTERQKINTYLSIKYGVPLDQTSPQDYLATDGSVIWNITRNAAYKNNIAGIGRDDAESLMQKQSLSINSGLQLLIGIGGLATDNRSNSNNFGSDKSYQMWGDNAAGTGYTIPVSSNAPGGNAYLSRMARTWKVSEMGTVGQVQVAIPALYAGRGNTTYIVVSSDSTFSTGCTWYALSSISVNGSSYMAALVNFTDGQFFTFASGITRGPGGVSGASIWLKADDLFNFNLTDSTPVSFWRNHGYTNTKDGSSSGTAQPLFRTNNRSFNFNPILNYDWSNDQIVIPYDSSYNRSFTAFTVNRQDGSNGARAPFGSRISTSKGWVYYHNNNVRTFWVGTGSTWATLNGNAYTYPGFGTADIACMELKQAGTSSAALYLNGLLSAQSNLTYQPNTNNGFASGSNSDPGGYWNGQISEQIVFSRAISNTERLQVSSYLAIKYGKSLNQTTPAHYYSSDSNLIIWNSKVNLAYKSNITGIGRDDASGLNQKQSLNSGSGLQLVIGLNRIASSNNTSTATFSADKSYEVWSDNGNPTSKFPIYVSNNAPSNPYKLGRMSRVWKIQETGTVDTIQVAIPTSYFSDTARYMIISADSTFGAGNVWIRLTPSTINNKNYYTVRYNFSNGQFFTYASRFAAPGGVSGVSVWLKADDASNTGLSNNSKVDTLVNRGIYGGDAFNTNPTTQPLYRNNPADNINFNPTIKQIGGALVTNYDSMINREFTTFSVHHLDATALASGSRYYMGCMSFVSGIYAGIQFSQSNTTRNGGAGTTSGYKNLTFFASTVSPELMGFTANTSLSSISYYLNGKAGSSTTGILGKNVNRSYVWGAAYDGSTGWFGRISEQVVYNTPVTATERQIINSYLAIKYGLTLDQSTPTHYLSTNGSIIWNANANAAFSSNITSIGRDDVEELNQKQSTSSNTGTQLLIGLNRLDSTNLSNPNNFSTDLSYETIGNNNLNLEFTVEINNNLPPGLNRGARMPRVWKVQETGTVDTVQLAILKSVFKRTEKYLVVSNDSSFSSGCTWHELDSMELNDSNYYCKRLNLNNGQFITFASKGIYPGGVSGMAIWLKADDLSDLGTADSTTVSTWRNFGISGAHARQTNAAVAPLFRKNSANLVNFNPCLVFNGANTYMSIAYSSTYNDNITGFSVNNLKPNTGVRCAFSSRSFASPFQGWMLFYNNNLRGLQTGTTSSNQTIAGGTYATPVTEIAGMDAKTGTSQTARIFVNGKTVTTSTITYTANTSKIFTTGASSELANYFLGNIFEQIVYGTVLHDTMRNRVNTYLSIKYGVSLDQSSATNYVSTDGKKIWNAGLNSIYKTNITGIGRDDAEGLYQKQSTNSTGGIQPVISIGTISTSNKDNPGVFPADISYFIWGDNGLSSAFGTAITNNLPSGVTGVYRMARVWKTQKTGTVDSVIIALSDAYISGNNKYVVMSNDSTFNSGNTWIALSNAGGSYLGAKVSTASGKFFTFVKSSTNPGGVEGVKLWIKSNDGDLLSKINNTTVSTWNNQANSSGNLIQNTGASQPLYKNNTTDNINFNPIVTFDGSNDYLTAPYSSTYNNRFTAFSVHNQTSASATRSPFGSRKNSLLQGWQYFHNSAVRTLTTGNGSAYSNLTGASYTQGNTEILGIFSDIGNNVSAGIFVNGASTGSGTVSYSSNLSNGYSTGSNSDPAAYWNGSIAEQILYDTTLSAAQNQRINTYLALKYGISLSQNSPYHYLATDASVIWNAGLNSTYKNNIAGIGRDDAEGLLQKQSTSINPGRQVIIGIGNIATDNASNTGQYTADKSYLIWGDNNGNMSFLTPISNNIPSGVSNPFRMARVWKVQETGNIPTVKLALQGTFASTAFKYLVVSMDSTFGSGTTWYPLTAQTINGSQYYSSNVNFAGGEFFTFVSKGNIHPGGVTGSTLWLRSDDETNSALGASVLMPYWLNSGNGADAVQPITASRPTYRNATNLNINYYPAVQFGSPAYFNLSDNLGLSGQTPITTFAVGNGTTSHYLRPSTALTNGADFYSAALGHTATGLYNSTTAAGTLTVTGAKAFISAGNRSGSNINAYTNGRLLNTAVSATAFAGNSSYNIGLSPTGTYNNASMLMTELIVYPNTLTASQQLRVNSYLAIKYGVSLDQTTPTSYVATDGTVIWNSAFNQAFNSNIAGLGRDDAEGLMQRQAMSSNSGTHLFVGVGGVLTSNINNTNNFTSDISYLTWGDNNQALTLTEQVVSGSRLARVWKFQKTGTVANVLIALPATVLGSATNMYVITHDNDSVFTSNYKRYQTSVYNINGVSYIGAIVPVISGQFATFASLQCNLPALANTNARTIVTNSYCNVGGWYYYKDPSNATQCLVAINPNGNTWNPDSVILDVNFAGTYSQTDGINTTELAKRMLTISAPGTYTVNGGIMVRMYYNPAEFSTLPNTTRQWFKHPGNKSNTLADITPKGLLNCSILTPDSSDTSNDIEFVEFRNITSFSTFGFGGTTDLVALPAKLISFKAEAKGQSAFIRWTLNNESSATGKMELYRSDDGIHWTSFRTMTLDIGKGLRNFEQIDPNPLKPQTFYKLSIHTESGENIQSEIAVLNWNESGAQVSLTPNPSNGHTLLKVTGMDLPKQYEIINPYGAVICRGSILDATEIDLHLENYPDGVYWIKIYDNDSVWTGRLVIIKDR